MKNLLRFLKSRAISNLKDKNMNQQELKNILELHRKWVLGEEGGSRANLSCANLSDANLRRADLRRANLSCADLSDADLRRANLSCADLSDADLSDADLSRADLRDADLRDADLRGADLRDADLRGADLSDADLRDADLKPIREDFFTRLVIAKNEAAGLYDYLKRGKVDGRSYEGECACFVGTVANVTGEKYRKLKCGLKPDSSSPTERWFLGIRAGDTPENNPVSKITCEWVEEFAKENGIELPRYRMVSSAEFPGVFQ